MKSLLKLKEFTDELETAESVLCTLGRSVEARDPYTEGHCERLSNRAVLSGAISVSTKNHRSRFAAAATCTTSERSQCPTKS